MASLTLALVVKVVSESIAAICDIDIQRKEIGLNEGSIL